MQERINLSVWTIAVGVVTYTFAIISHLMGWNGLFALGALLPAVLWAIVGLNKDKLCSTYVVWRSVWVVAVPAWYIFSQGLTPWSPWVYGSAFALVAVFAIGHPAIPKHMKSLEVMARIFTPRHREWADRIKRIDGTHVLDLDIKDWEGRKGLTVSGNFPQGGYTWKSMAGNQARYASDIRLETGCSLEIGRGGHAGAFQINVSFENVFAEARELEMPEPGSVNEPCVLGPLANGKMAVLEDLRQESVRMMGAIGSGKSNGVAVLGAWHATRTDQVLFIADLTGGRLGGPFLSSYLKGETERPAIEGMPETPEQLHALLTWFLDVAEDRARRFRDYMLQENTTKLPVSRDLPAYRLIIDEPKVICDAAPKDPVMREIMAMITKIQETCRAMAIRVDFTGLAGTIGTFPIEWSRQIRYSIGFRAENEQQLANVLGWNSVRGLDITSLALPGMAYWKDVQGGAPRLTRFPEAKPLKVAEISKYVAGVRPDIDEAAKSVPSYAGIRNRWNWQKEAQAIADSKSLTVDRPKLPVPASQAVQPTQGASASPQVDSGKRMASALADMNDFTEQLRRTRMEQEEKIKAAQEQLTFQELESEMTLDAFKVKLIEFLSKETIGETGELIEYLQNNGFNNTRQHLQTKISELAKEGFLTKVSRGNYRLSD